MALLRLLFFLLLLFFTACKQESEVINGYVEADYQYVAATSSGLLKTLNVSAGDQVKSGQTLFSLEDTILKTDLASAIAIVEELNVIQEEANKDYIRAKELLATNAISQAVFDKKFAVFSASLAKLANAKQSVIAFRKRIQEAAPIAAQDAFVEDTFFLPGEFVAAGQPVVSILDPSKLKIRFFVPQQKLPNIKLNQKILISCDGCARKVSGVISYIAKRAEYTPPIIFSQESRHKLVFMVEAKFEQNSMLHVGIPVNIELVDLS